MLAEAADVSDCDSETQGNGAPGQKTKARTPALSMSASDTQTAGDHRFFFGRWISCTC